MQCTGRHRITPDIAILPTEFEKYIQNTKSGKYKIREMQSKEFEKYIREILRNTADRFSEIQSIYLKKHI